MRILGCIKNFLYDISVKLHRKTGDKKKTLKSKKISDIVFCCVILAYPTIQFILFYLAVNLNSILLAFKQYDVAANGQYQTLFSGIENFKDVIYDFMHTPMLLSAVKNSLILFVATIVVGISLSLIFSFFIYKKIPGNGLFKIILFLPTVVSPIVLVLVFSHFVETFIPQFVLEVFHVKVKGVLSNVNTTFGALLFFTVFVNFGVSVMMFTGAMGGINDSVIESAELDGAGFFKEFIHIVVPMIYPTIIMFLIVGIAGIFTNQMNLYSFYGDKANYDYYTIGYYFYRMSKLASIKEYPYLSAMGCMMSIVSVAITLTSKKLLEKLGPKAY